MKKIPLRKCLATNKMLPKEDLLRIVKNQNGEISVDLTNKKEGRGAYIAKDLNALEIAKKRKVLDHAFKTNVPESIYIELAKIIEEGE